MQFELHHKKASGQVAFVIQKSITCYASKSVLLNDVKGRIFTGAGDIP